MSNSGTRIYTETVGGVKNGVSIDDVQTVFGLTAKNIGDLIEAAEINPWALYKPVQASSGPQMVTRDLMETMGFTDMNGNVRIPYATTIQGLIDMYTDGESNTVGNKRANGWRYVKPSDWFRLLDFVKCASSNGRIDTVDGVGYDDDATCPFGTFDCTQSLTRNGGVFQATVAKTLPSGSVSEEYITITDMNGTITSGYRMLYFGVLLVPASTSYAYKLIYNNETTIETGERGKESLLLDSYTFVSGSWPVSDFIAYPFLTNTPLSSTTRLLTYRYSQRDTTLPGRLYPLPGSVPVSVNVFDYYIVIEVYAEAATVLGSTYNTNIYFTIRNNYSSAITISSMWLKWRLLSNDYSDARETGEVFYDGEYRYDDSNPSGYRDSSYSYLLTTSWTIDAGKTITVPGTDLSAAATIPSSSTSRLYIGTTYNYTDQYGYKDIVMPVI